MKPSSNFKFAAAIYSMLLAGFASQAQEHFTLTPEQIVSQTIDHSYSLQSANQEINATSAQYRQAKAQSFPTLDTQAKAARYQGLEDSSLGPDLTLPAIENRYSASIGVTQPLYTGGRISNQKESARFQNAAAEHTRNATEADLILSALSAYWNWSKAYFVVQSLESAVARTEAHAMDMRHQHEAGLVTDNDLLATEVQLDQTKLSLEEAQNRVALARARIQFLTGQSLGTNEIPEKAIVPPEWNTSATNAEADAISHRPEKAARLLEVKAAEAQAKSSQADFYPQIALVARYEQANPNSLDFPPADEWNDDAFAGVTLSWDVFDWGLTKAKAAEAAARAKQARLRLSQVEEQITLEVQEAQINLRDAISRIAVAQRAEQSAQRNVQAATDLWQNGLARHSDVLDALARLTDAQYQLTATLADAVLAHIQLEHATGKLVLPDSKQHAAR